MPFLQMLTCSARATALWARLLGAVAALLLAEPVSARPCCAAPVLHTSDCGRVVTPVPEGIITAQAPGSASPESSATAPAAPPTAPPPTSSPETLPETSQPETAPNSTEVAPAPETPPGPVPVEPAQPGESYPQFFHSGQIQFQVDDGSLGSPRANVRFPASGGIGPFPADSRIFVRRFRPAFDLAFSPNFDLQTEFNIDPQTERIQILDVRFNHDLSEKTYLSAGRFKVPFGWEGLRSSRATNTIERSDMTLALYPERDIGLSLTHRQTHLGQFSLGTFLGQPRSNGASNGQFDLIGRGLFRINDDLQIGVSGHTGTYRITGTETDLPVRRIGTELHYNSGPWKVEAEAMWSDGFNTFSGSSTPAAGYYAAAVYRVADPLDLVLHYDRFDPDTAVTDSLVADNSTNARDRKVIGLNYYLDRDLMHRIMLNYEWKQDLEGPGLHTSGFRLRYQLAW